MSSSKKVPFDFYRVKMTMGGIVGRNFPTALNNVMELPDDETRNCLMPNNHPCRIQTLSRNKNIWIGEIIQIRMTDIPQKASLKGSMEDIDLADDEGIGQGVVFLYNSTYNVLVIQRNKFAVSAVGLAKYMSEKGRCGALYLENILSAEAWRRFNEMKTIKKFSIRVSGLEKGDVNAGQGYGVSDIASLVEKVGAPNLQVIASVGHSRGNHLNFGAVKRLVTAALGLSRKDEVLDQLEVEGINIEEASDKIDLLSECITANEEVDSDGRRTLSYESRTSAILRAWDTRLAEIAEQFKPIKTEEPLWD